MIVSDDSRMFRAISFGVFCRAGSFDQRDHAVDEGVAGRRGDLDHDPVGQHLRPARDGAAVAAALADHRSRLAGDGGLVDAGDAVDHVAIARDGVACLADDPVPEPQLSGGHERLDTVGAEPAGRGVAPRGPQGGGLGPTAALRHGLGQVGEHHGQPQPDGHAPARRRSARRSPRRSSGARRRGPRTSRGCATWSRGSSFRRASGSEVSRARGSKAPEPTRPSGTTSGDGASVVMTVPPQGVRVPGRE